MDKRQGFEKAESRVEEAWRKYLGEVKEPNGWIQAILQPVLIEFSRRAFFAAWDLASKEPCCYGMAVAGNQHSDDCPLSIVELQAALGKVLRHVTLCVCLRPATYQRALVCICDKCAADPELEWDFGGRESCLLSQAEAVRSAVALLKVKDD